ncbi:MAG: hypothetical protein HOD43_06420 [Candidatus Marinimicrobia bacterium]|nr:hypothetical protein [Candidatus Neomarinimicrobiota bacterium]MBT3631301.1 hypothetical protein [Candidatus Neomarinimicrobiota bacterium]MBT3824300.1 hypothetical protein [Candidatus Neomarinimicrobiota bacterium]MBT4129435.1 hypothetical protein [Candidatus Neomarinimicrobiota bacterium]MBT4295426.1 hypothetical protein [Candidatus Neomarinimicrobiota bacterium]
MFTNARYFIKTAFGFIILGLFSGLYIYGARAFGWSMPFTIIQAHTHVLLMGGIFMMILGVAVWFLPRAKKDDTRYNPDVIRVSYFIFTFSTLFRFIVEILQGYYPQSMAAQVGFWCSVFQVAASIVLIYSLWGRIRPVGSQIREQRGEKF